MTETDKNIDCEDAVVKAIKEEYEKKLEEERARHAEEMKASEEKHVAQIRALLSGRNDTEAQRGKENVEEQDEVESAIEKLRKKYLKGR